MNVHIQNRQKGIRIAFDSIRFDRAPHQRLRQNQVHEFIYMEELSIRLKELIEKDGIGEQQGGVGFAEVEADGLLIGGAAGLAMDYSVGTYAGSEHDG